MVEPTLGLTRIAIPGPSSNWQSISWKTVANELKPHAAHGPFCAQAETPEKCSLPLAHDAVFLKLECFSEDTLQAGAFWRDFHTIFPIGESLTRSFRGSRIAVEKGGPRGTLSGRPYAKNFPRKPSRTLQVSGRAE